MNHPETGIEKGTFRPYDILAGLSYGTKLSNSVSLGISAKFLQETIDEQKAQAFAVDLGGMYSMKNGFIIGANVQHLGTKMKFVEESFGLPLNFNVGVAYKLLDNALTFAVDANIPTDNDVNVGFGADYRIMGIFDLRFGYRYTSGGNDLGTASGLRAGVGFGIGSYKLDYAFVPYGELGQSHRISLVASF
jgi:long-subunit fatty acid transport protein